MPSCSLRVSPDAFAPLSGSNGHATYTLPLPNAPALVGLHLYNQAFVVDPQAGNTSGLVLSDAADARIGV